MDPEPPAQDVGEECMACGREHEDCEGEEEANERGVEKGAMLKEDLGQAWETEEGQGMMLLGHEMHPVVRSIVPR